MPPSPEQNEEAPFYAAVDIGSNSFHLVVARLELGRLRLIDRIKDMVRLAEGVGPDGELSQEVADRALASLARLGQRLRGIPDENIRAVGTQALRRMNNANAFLMVAETGLGCPIEIISGREEARLIYAGVAEGMGGPAERRLVVDIGGGSTELVIGEGRAPLLLESMQYGCVTVTNQYFADGRIDQERWNQARDAIRADLQELLHRYVDTGWQQVIGSSGTIRAVFEVCRQAGWCEKSITPAAVSRLQDYLIRCGHVRRVRIDGLSDRRHPVFVGGVVILDACMQDLGISDMDVSGYALREGVLYDLLGRLEHRDPRQATVDVFSQRYGIDSAQFERVRDTALALYEQVQEQFGLRQAHREMLDWASQLHEAGLAIAHSSYQNHSAYLVAQSDMAGFSQQEQQFLATLVGHHRRSIPHHYHRGLPTRLQDPCDQLLFLLRLAVILCRSRADSAIPDLMLGVEGRQASLSLPQVWLDTHPLSLNDLHQEASQSRQLGFELQVGPMDQPGPVSSDA